MPLVDVAATVRYRCRDARGRYYTQTDSITATVEDNSDPIQLGAMAYQASGAVAPEGCVGVDVQLDSVTPASGGGPIEPPPGQPVSVYARWTCTGPDGRVILTRTIKVDVNTSDDIGAIEAEIEAVSTLLYTEEYCADIPGSTVGWEVVSPAYYHYYTER